MSEAHEIGHWDSIIDIMLWSHKAAVFSPCAEENGGGGREK